MTKNLKYLPLALFSILSAKGMILGFSLNDVLALAILGLVGAYYEFKAESSEMKKLIEAVKQNEKDMDQLKKDLDGVRTSLASVRMASGVRTMQKLG
jgi:hypothetical protein